MIGRPFAFILSFPFLCRRRAFGVELGGGFPAKREAVDAVYDLLELADVAARAEREIGALRVPSAHEPVAVLDRILFVGGIGGFLYGGNCKTSDATSAPLSYLRKNRKNQPFSEKDGIVTSEIAKVLQLLLWYNSSWRPFVVDVLLLHHVFYHDCGRHCNIYPARHPHGGGSCGLLTSASSTDPSPFPLSLSTPRNDLSRVSHDRVHFSRLTALHKTADFCYNVKRHA